MSVAIGVITNALQQGLESLLIKPARSIGPLVLQVTIEESHDDELEITDHPIEKGAIISDHAYKRPARVVIRGAWSNSPSLSGLIDGVIGGLKATIVGGQQVLSGKAPTTINDHYAKLLRLQSDAIPFDIYTGRRRYSNMLIQSISHTTDERNENTLPVTIVCREVILVSTRLVTVPTDASKQANPQSTLEPANSGTKSLTDGSKYSNAGAGRGFVNPPQ